MSRFISFDHKQPEQLVQIIQQYIMRLAQQACSSCHELRLLQQQLLKLQQIIVPDKKSINQAGFFYSNFVKSKDINLYVNLLADIISYIKAESSDFEYLVPALNQLIKQCKSFSTILSAQSLSTATINVI